MLLLLRPVITTLAVSQIYLALRLGRSDGLVACSILKATGTRVVSKTRWVHLRLLRLRNLVWID